MISFFNDYIVSALVLGSIYALGAIGISMIYAILRFAHFAHGDFLTLGAYLALEQIYLFGVRKSRPIIMVIASFGVALMLRACFQLFWGVDDFYYWGIQPPLESLEPFLIGAKHLYIAGAVIILISATHYLLAYTRTGKAMRAMSDDPDLARVTGIPTERIVVWTWIVGAALAAAAGILLGMDTRVKFDMGWNLLLPMFAAAILGGLGRPYGAIAGGMVIGGLEELSTLVIPGDYKSAVAFAVMVLVLIFRPQGIFKGRVI
jgi:branched-chain amino acid transport system permease protein